MQALSLSPLSFFTHSGRPFHLFPTPLTLLTIPTSPATPPLLSLPPEILILILQPLLIFPFTVPIIRHWDLTSPHRYCIVRDISPPTFGELHCYLQSTSVIYTCRSLYSLGGSLYYHNNHFAISIDSLPRLIVDLPPGALSEIRSLEVQCCERFADWSLWPLLADFRGLERLILAPPIMQQWNSLSGMKHLKGIAPLTLQCAGHAGSGDVVRGSDPDLMAAVSRDEEKEAYFAMEEAVMRRMPRLTGFWIVRRDPRTLNVFNPGSEAVMEANNREVEKAVVLLIHRREREKGGACECQHVIPGEGFCCNKCPLKEWEVEGAYRPLEADMRRWKPLEAKSWDWSLAFGNASREPFLEENFWGVNNVRIMRRLNDDSRP